MTTQTFDITHATDQEIQDLFDAAEAEKAMADLADELLDADPAESDDHSWIDEFEPEADSSYARDLAYRNDPLGMI